MRLAALLALAGVIAWTALSQGGSAHPGVPIAHAGQPPNCFGEIDAEGVPRRPGPLMRYGITPRVQAGQVGGVPAEAVPERPEETHRALARLRPQDGPFVLRLNRLFFSEGEGAIREFERLTERYTSRGYLVEYQLRYHPDEQQEGDMRAWRAFVREAVRRLGDDPRVSAFQVTNEVNFKQSPDSSDGSYRRAKDALIQGVIAAKDEARRRGYEQLEIGFNWFYRTDPGNEREFWEYLRDHGGPRFLGSLDWIGLDAYPGTFFPPVEPTLEDYRDGMVNAMSTLRCLAQIPGIPASVPMHVEENGWPTGPGRPPERQAAVARALVTAVHDFRGTYNVSDYRWFNLRDADSSDPRFTQQYGLLRDDYSDKPAFPVYCQLVARLSRGNPTEGPNASPARCAAGAGRPAGGGGARFPCTVRGTSGNDVIRGTASADVICAAAGNDVVRAGGGDDTVYGGAGNDALRGDGGGDRLTGESGGDVLNTSDGVPANDLSEGGVGSDACNGDYGDERRGCEPR